MDQLKILDAEDLSKIRGGGQPDYNFGYKLGRGFRGFTNSVSRNTHNFSKWVGKHVHF